LQENVLRFLQDEEFLKLGSEELHQLELDTFTEPLKSANRAWQCRPALQKDGIQAKKMLISEAYAACPASESVNGLKLQQAKLQRTHAWRNSFMSGNKLDFDVLKNRIDKRVKSLPCKQHKNCAHLLESTADNLFLSGAMTFIAQTDGLQETLSEEESARVLLAEDGHTDGARGMLHCGISHYTCRMLRCTFSGHLPVGVEQKPGSLWLTNSTSFQHQALHLPSTDESRFCAFGEFAACSISTMIRNCFFPSARSVIGNRTPAPQEAFHAVTDTITTWLIEYGASLQLPTLEAVQEEHSRLVRRTSAVEAAPAAKRRKPKNN